MSHSQINKKYDFLSSAKVCIDLCAAPGGWCQVAAKYMPRGGIILGVDLLPIRAIPNVKTLVHDITTDECRTALKREMQTWKVGRWVGRARRNFGGKEWFVGDSLKPRLLSGGVQADHK